MIRIQGKAYARKKMESKTAMQSPSASPKNSLALEVIELDFDELEAVQGGLLVTGTFILAGGALIWAGHSVVKFANNQWRASVQRRTQLPGG
jgi:hypothetical protein